MSDPVEITQHLSNKKNFQTTSKRKKVLQLISVFELLLMDNFKKYTVSISRVSQNNHN